MAKSGTHVRRLLLARYRDRLASGYIAQLRIIASSK
jgi:hypothetical protein